MRQWFSGCLCVRWLHRSYSRTTPSTHNKQGGRVCALRKGSTAAQSIIDCEPGSGLVAGRHTPLSAKTPLPQANKPLQEYVFPRKKQNTIRPSS